MALLDNMLDVMDQGEQSFSPRLEAALAAAMDELLVAAKITPLAIFVPRPARAVIVENLANLWAQIVYNSADVMLGELGGLRRKAENVAVAGQILTKYADSYGGERAAAIILTTEKQIADLLRGGLLRGEAQQAVFANVANKIPELAAIRAALITRTEAHTVSQFTSQVFAERSGLPLTKVWSSVSDDKTRRFGIFGRQDAFNHLVMNGVSVALDRQFLVPRREGGHEALLFPGHPAGSAGNVINCRCVQTYERN